MSGIRSFIGTSNSGYRSNLGWKRAAANTNIRVSGAKRAYAGTALLKSAEGRGCAKTHTAQQPVMSR